MNSSSSVPSGLQSHPKSRISGQSIVETRTHKPSSQSGASQPEISPAYRKLLRWQALNTAFEKEEQENEVLYYLRVTQRADISVDPTFFRQNVASKDYVFS